MTEPRTFIVRNPPMRGDDISAWQDTLNRQMRTWKIDHRLKTDGIYGVGTRDLTASVVYGLGMERESMSRGVTPALRVKLRNKDLTAAERSQFKARVGWRKRLRKRHEDRLTTARIVLRVIADSWGWVPGVHDGLDVICDEDAPIYAACDGEIIRADTGGWWGKAPSGDVTKGDGIIVIRCETDAGPFSKGLNIGYGHAERPIVRVGQKVRAGQRIGTAGTAVVPHIHWMVNGRNDAKGVGDRDPEPFYRYAMGER